MLNCGQIAEVLASGQIYFGQQSEYPKWLRNSLELVCVGNLVAANEELSRHSCSKDEFANARLQVYLHIRCLLNLGEIPAAAQLLQSRADLLEPYHLRKLQVRLLISSGNPADARPLLLECLNADPYDWEALALLALLSEPAESELLFAQSLLIQPQQADAMRNRAALRLRQGLLEEAISELKQVLNWRPTFTPALELLNQPMLERGEIHSLEAYYLQLPDWCWTSRITSFYISLLIALGKSDQAWRRAQNAMSRWPDNPDLMLTAASAAQAAGKLSAASQIYWQLHNSGTNSIAARSLNNLALLAVNNDDLLQAVELITQACQLLPDDTDLQLHRVELQLRQGEQEAAAAGLETLRPSDRNLNPAQHRRWLLAHSRLLQRQGQLLEALEVAQKARIAWPVQADTWLQEAAVLADLQRVDEGIALIQESIIQVEHSRDLQDALLAYLINQGRLALADQLLDQWLQQEPDDSGLLAQKAGLQIDLGNLEAAEGQLRYLVQLNYTKGSVALIKFLLQRNRPAEALAVCEDAIAKDPQRIVPYQLAAQALAQLERWPEAIEILYLAHLNDPERLDVIGDLVKLQIQQGQPNAAILLLEAEIVRRPRLPLLRMALQVLQRTKNWSRGLALLASLEKSDPHNSELQLLKVRLLRRQGDCEGALAISRELVAAHPTNVKLRSAHIRELLIQEQYADAIRQAYDLADCLSDSPQRLLELVGLLKAADAPDEALKVLKEHLPRWPDHPQLPWQVIDLLDCLSRTVEAQAHLDAFMSAQPVRTAELLHRASSTSLRHRAYVAAAAYAQEWHKLQPASVAPLWQMFYVYSEQRSLDQALLLIAQIRQSFPHDPHLDASEAQILIKYNRYNSATRLLDSAIVREPTNQALKDQRLVLRTTAGDFSSFDVELAELDRLRGENRYAAHSSYFFNINCHPSWTIEKVFAFHNDWYTKAIEPTLPEIPSYPADQLNPSKRLKIGYVSGDFRRHSVAYFSEPLLIAHDRDQFELYAFANHNSAESCATTDRFRSYVDHWVDTYGMDDGELYRRIRSIGIDILVDLSGHTSGSRLLVFARKPAPLQFSVVFAAGQTTGIHRIDYMLCDQFSIPPEFAPYLTEKRAELPFDGIPYKPGDDFIDPCPLPSLKGAPFTFGCITRPVRVNSDVCKVWGQILSACPQARLVFEHGSYEETEVQDYYRQLLVEAGAHSRQIVFRNTRPYWNLFHDIDLLLDTWPAGSGTVGTDALWMERLTLTLCSRPPMGRLMAAQLNSLGLADYFVCNDIQSYCERAIIMATTSSGRSELALSSTGLRQKIIESALMDYPGYSKAVASIYRELWAKRCADCSGSTPLPE